MAEKFFRPYLTYADEYHRAVTPEDWDDVKGSLQFPSRLYGTWHGLRRRLLGFPVNKKRVHTAFRTLDHDFAHLKSFSIYNESVLDERRFSESEYEDFAAMYKNVMEEMKSRKMTQILKKILFVKTMNLWHTAIAH